MAAVVVGRLCDLDSREIGSPLPLFVTGLLSATFAVVGIDSGNDGCCFLRLAALLREERGGIGAFQAAVIWSLGRSAVAATSMFIVVAALLASFLCAVGEPPHYCWAW
ncbi:hypothetical protein TB1_006951 [Malus domestica]